MNVERSANKKSSFQVFVGGVLLPGYDKTRTFPVGNYIQILARKWCSISTFF